jgi:hypothetical protein
MDHGGRNTRPLQGQPLDELLQFLGEVAFALVGTYLSAQTGQALLNVP